MKVEQQKDSKQKKIVQIEDLSVSFDGMEVVKHVNIEVNSGEIVGIVGESGSGKSITSLTLMGLLSKQAQVTSGKIIVDGEVLREADRPFDERLYRRFQGSRMSMIFQEPMTSLNPTKKAGIQVDEIVRLHTDLEKEKRYEKVLETFQAVGLKDAKKVYDSYPHQLSGGMRQRVMIAMAVILHPDLIIADEPTTALDVTIQTQIVELLKDINKSEQNAMLFITHDLNLARRICHKVVVMKDGVVVEADETEKIFMHPKEVYTRNLIEAVPSRLKPRVSVKKESNTKVLTVKDLSVYYEDRSNSIFKKKEKQYAVEHVSFDVYEGESLGLVGESGCGKTSLSKAILGMQEHMSGEVSCHVSRPQMIFQDPYSSLNPSKTIGWLLMEPLRAAGILDKKCAMSKADRKAAAYDMLARVGMDEKYFHRLPSELSGGQRQRISIAQALITNPGFIIADEPVSALDVTIQAQIMELLQKLQEEMNLSYLFISHDINVVYHMCDRIMVMKDGRVIEIGETEDIFHDPKEAYTKSLLV
jgi:ABC-type glutathione transport system ATPase component